MPKHSGGLLIYKKNNDKVEVLLTHPGGPFWAKKENGCWSIPKGEVEADEDLLAAAKREFMEELGFVAPESDNLIELTQLKQSSGKINHIWALEGDVNLSLFKSQLIEIAWPPRSGQVTQVPENDRVEWFSLSKAKQKLFTAQVPFIDELADKLGVIITSPTPEEPTESPQTSLF